MKKGQIFTLDVLAALVVLTVIISLLAWQVEQFTGMALETEYDRMASIANDVANMAVKRDLVNSPSPNIIPVEVDSEDLSQYAKNFGYLLPSGYYGEIVLDDVYVAKQGCDSASQVVAAKRIVHYNNEVKLLEVRVCA